MKIMREKQKEGRRGGSMYMKMKMKEKYYINEEEILCQ